MELGLMISGYSGPRLRPIQIFIGPVHILSVSVSVSGSVNEPLGRVIQEEKDCYYDMSIIFGTSCSVN